MLKLVFLGTNFGLRSEFWNAKAFLFAFFFGEILGHDQAYKDIRKLAWIMDQEHRI